jgi:hypothetical protein
VNKAIETGETRIGIPAKRIKWEIAKIKNIFDVMLL